MRVCVCACVWVGVGGWVCGCVLVCVCAGYLFVPCSLHPLLPRGLAV